MWYASIPYYLNILPPYFFRELIHHQCVTENFLLDAEAYWLPWVEGAIATVPGWIICIRKSNKILIKNMCHFCTKQTHIFLHWGKQQHSLPLILFLSVFHLIFVCKLFSPGQLQWPLPPMEVSKILHPTKSFYDALIMD